MTALFTKTNNRDDAFAPEQKAEDARPLVLVVEDHEDTCFLLNCLLEIYGCRALEARDGEAAIRMAADARPDLVLMDVNLPRLDGLKATDRMRQTPALRDVPIIFLSGYAEKSFLAEALARGGNDYLVKPFTPDEIKRVVETYLGVRINREQVV